MVPIRRQRRRSGVLASIRTSNTPETPLHASSGCDDRQSSHARRGARALPDGLHRRGVHERAGERALSHRLVLHARSLRPGDPEPVGADPDRPLRARPHALRAAGPAGGDPRAGAGPHRHGAGRIPERAGLRRHRARAPAGRPRPGRDMALRDLDHLRPFLSGAGRRPCSTCRGCRSTSPSASCSTPHRRGGGRRHAGPGGGDAAQRPGDPQAHRAIGVHAQQRSVLAEVSRRNAESLAALGMQGGSAGAGAS